MLLIDGKVRTFEVHPHGAYPKARVYERVHHKRPTLKTGSDGKPHVDVKVQLVRVRDEELRKEILATNPSSPRRIK